MTAFPQTVTTNYFSSGAEGWVFTTDQPDWVTGVWYSRCLTFDTGQNRRPLPPVSTYRGCLKCTIRKNCPASNNYWTYTGTWESLGIPAGVTILSVSMKYAYRWQCQTNSKHLAIDNLADFSGLSAGIGPATFRTSTGTLLGTFSNRNYCIDRAPSEGVQWKTYPTGSFQKPIQEYPNAWAVATGSSVAVSYPQSRSSSTIQLRIDVLQPALAGSFGFGQHAWLRAKIDTIQLTVETSNGSYFLVM